MSRDATTTSGQNPALPEVYGYRLLRVLGYGGMSTVYLARQASLDREVALKVMLPEALTDEVSRRRFENEARTIARLDHPNIVGIHEVGRTGDGLPYYAMPYLARGHLGQREFGHDQARVRAVLHDLLSALEYAHARGVVHRDVKAENVLFDDSERPLLADFGIALRRGYGTRVTTAGLAVGSTAYMPPEQARGHSVDGRADLYSVGVLGWEMLTGRLPYNAGDALSMALQHAQEPIPRLPPELRHWQKFFDRALAKTPEARFAGAREMRQALDRVPERGRARGPAPAAGRTAAWLALAAATALAAIAGSWYWNARNDGAPAPVAPAPAGGATAAAATTATTTATASTQADAALDSLMRPLPESPAERLVADAQRQIRQERWTTPPGDNAYDSLLAAAAADRAHPRLAPAAAALVDALATQARDAIAAGRNGAAQAAVERARTLAKAAALPARDGAAPGAIARMDAALVRALDARLASAALAGDPRGRRRLLAAARRLGLPAADLRRLAAGDAPGDRAGLATEAGWTLLRGGRGGVAIADAPVSHGDYARFAEATRREGALCRERGSLLRLLAHRDWKSPGFEQSPQQPVVCVSWKDAHAYAQWLGARDGRRYRLANADEAGAAPAGGARPVAAWTDACAGGDCAHRVATGRSWRGGAARRDLQADRGYDDVGFRLARDL